MTMKRYNILFALLIMAHLAPLHARLNIEISGGAIGALPIAIVPLTWSGPTPLAEAIDQIVTADLARTGRFAPLQAGAMPAARPSTGKEIDFEQWRKTGVDNIIVGRITPQGSDFVVQFQLFDIHRGKQLSGYSIPTKQAALRQTAHQISDIVYEKLTGVRGAFNTRISYVMVTEEGGARQYQLAVADSDGFNEQIILTSKEALMSPAWSADGKRLAYVSFESGRSKLYIQELSSGQRDMVADHKGLNSSPAWSPDGRRLAMTLSKDGNPEIYILDLATKQLQRVTRSYGIDTEAAWMTDGSGLIFTSDRGGKPQLYQVRVSPDGQGSGRAERLTFEGGYNVRAAVSPDGKRVAMVHQEGSAYRIGVMELASGNLRVVTNTTLDESPSFAANGSMIIYATEVGGRGVLQAVAVDGSAHQRLELSRGDVRDPAWSPYLFP